MTSRITSLRRGLAGLPTAPKDHPGRRLGSLLGVALMGLLTSNALAATDPICVGVGILPVANVIQSLGAQHVRVTVLVGPGQNYHTYEPTPKQVSEIAAASLYFQMGLSFERRLIGKIQSASPTLRVVDLLDGITLRPMDTDQDDGHAEHETADPHVWLSPLNVKILARNAEKMLQESDPTNAAAYSANLAALERDLDALHARVATTLAPFKGRTFYVYHPSFGYFADLYGLKQKAIEVDGKEPTARQLTELIDRARAEHVHAILVQVQFPRKPAEAIAREIGGKVIAVDPLAGDYVTGIDALALSLAEAWTAP